MTSLFRRSASAAVVVTAGNSFVLTLAVVCGGLLWTAGALAAPTAQQKCDNARITAWKKYKACVNGVVAKDAKGTIFDRFAAFAKCRHKYFGKWAAFQSYTGSICAGSRFTDNLDQTVTDHLTGLTWEKKNAKDGSAFPNGFPHDADNTYTLSTGSPWKENGTAYTDFFLGIAGDLCLTPSYYGLNIGAFAGSQGWRIPTLAELQTILLDFECKGDGGSPTCICPSAPCVDPALDAANTADFYWSATSDVPDPSQAWDVGFLVGPGSVNPAGDKTAPSHVRAVRGGL